MSEVLRERSMDELILLPEGDAVRTWLDLRNGRVLFRLLLLLSVVMAVAVVALLSDQADARLAIPIADLILIRVLFVLRERPIFARHLRAFILGVLAIQPLMVMGLYFTPSQLVHPVDFMLPALFLAFRLPMAQALIPAGALWAATVGRNLVQATFSEVALDFPLIVGYTVLLAVVMLVIDALTRSQLNHFLDRWRRENRRHRERLRMRGEIDEARRIQLSMLPRRDPKLPWLDIAGISLPASEVGGDYYDYFSVSDDRQVIVVGDVAGHGVGSGILLAGVRSCLYLLHESEPPSPVEILGKLDRMVRQTTGSRDFITLLYALFDRRSMAVTLCVAGHPPLYHSPADGEEPREHGSFALPLGTRLRCKLAQAHLTVAAGDVIALVTDGVAETVNARQQAYGDERLKRRVHESRQRSAREIRDALLADLWNFKGDAEQHDDVTVIIAKLR